ncbi:MAG: AMP-binding protein [Gammaproteobacteria bacterium]|nr:AMP-binding protein [Gammaproteobacteria bacterium]
MSAGGSVSDVRTNRGISLQLSRSSGGGAATRVGRQSDPGCGASRGRRGGHPCAPGKPGELVHRGALVALGYWNRPEETAERFRPAPAAPPH